MITLLYERKDGFLEKRLVEDDFKFEKYPHFKAVEFLVNRNSKLALACVSEYDLETLQFIRILYNIPCVINSAGRTPDYNSTVPGASKTSTHQYLFNCLDPVFPLATKEQLDYIYQYFHQRGYTGIGRYDNGRFHIDIGYRDKLTVWDERRSV